MRIRNPASRCMGRASWSLQTGTREQPAGPFSWKRSWRLFSPSPAAEFQVCGLLTKYLHMYVEYRAVSRVCQNIDPPHPFLHPASVSSPRTKGGGYTLAGRWEGWGVNILEDERHRIGLFQCVFKTRLAVWLQFFPVLRIRILAWALIDFDRMDPDPGWQNW